MSRRSNMSINSYKYLRTIREENGKIKELKVQTNLSLISKLH